MTDLTAAFVPPSLLATTAIPTAPTNPAEAAKRAKIHETAQKFETQFLSIMVQQMFDGTDTPAPFGGGQGETMFRSFMTEAMAKQMSQGGGVGIADAVNREMLKMQGLS